MDSTLHLGQTRLVNYRTLGNTGLHVSVIGFGASSLGGVFRQTDDAESIRTVHLALDHGINFIDVSPYYGATRAETVLGKALKGVPRHRYILATKVGQYDDEIFDFSADRVVRSLDESCARLGVEYIDLLQCHDIEFASVDQLLDETLPALVRLRAAGRIGHIGITGLPLRVLVETVGRADDGVIETVLSFCHFELNDSSLAEHVPYFHSRGIGVINASPTGMGLLTERGVPPWHLATPRMVEVAQQAVGFCRANGIDIVKLAVQYAISHPGIATTLVGTANPANILRNIAYAEAPVEFEMIARVLEILRPIHNHNFTRGRPENLDEIIS
jgi:L-galactose dehydrogenase